MAQKVTMSKKEFVREHKKLVQTLRSHGAKKEADSQERELKKVQKKEA